MPACWCVGQPAACGTGMHVASLAAVADQRHMVSLSRCQCDLVQATGASRATSPGMAHTGGPGTHQLPQCFNTCASMGPSCFTWLHVAPATACRNHQPTHAIWPTAASPLMSNHTAQCGTHRHCATRCTCCSVRGVEHHTHASHTLARRLQGHVYHSAP
jgi:hypothetical protein